MAVIDFGTEQQTLPAKRNEVNAIRAGQRVVFDDRVVTAPTKLILYTVYGHNLTLWLSGWLIEEWLSPLEQLAISY